MTGINETELDQDRWHIGVFQHVQVLSLFDPSPFQGNAEMTERLSDAFREPYGVLATPIHPNLGAASLSFPWQICVIIRVAVDGHEYIALARIRAADPGTQGDCLVRSSDQLGNNYVVLLQAPLKLEYDAERNIFLHQGRNWAYRARVGPSMSRIEHYDHDA